MSHDPYAGRDTRARLLADKQTFDRMEPTTRRALLVLGILALGIGLTHHFLTRDPFLAAQVSEHLQLFDPRGR